MGLRITVPVGRAIAMGLVAAVIAVAAGCSRTPGTVAVVAALDPCRLKGVEIALRCATIDVLEDRDAAGGASSDARGRTIPIRFAVIPALAAKPEADPVFVLAGGPGQAATDVAAQVVPLFRKLNQERDIVLVDQRGTGGSHRLACDSEDDADTFAGRFDATRIERQVALCAERLGKDADLTRYGTSVAVADLDDVRQRLGYRTVNLWGASYGTRVALAYLQQFPDRVRTMTLDGVAPASMKLPLTFGVDTYAAMVRLERECAGAPGCAARYPALASDVTALFARLAAGQNGGAAVEATDPVTGVRQRLTLTPAGLASLLRGPLYLPLTASLVPAAVSRAVDGDYGGLAALGSTLGAGRERDIALGMHLSVVCSEDVASIDAADVDAARGEAARSRVDGRPNPFATIFLDQYRRLCAHWPVRPPPADHAASLAGRPGADVPALLLSGGLDPATPPAHATTIAAQLTRARSVVAPNVGHGVSLQGCAPDVIERFVRSADAAALDTKCLDAIPRPPFFVPVVEARRGDAKRSAPPVP